MTWHLEPKKMKESLKIQESMKITRKDWHQGKCQFFKGMTIKMSCSISNKGRSKIQHQWHVKEEWIQNENVCEVHQLLRKQWKYPSKVENCNAGGGAERWSRKSSWLIQKERRNKRTQGSRISRGQISRCQTSRPMMSIAKLNVNKLNTWIMTKLVS